MSVEKRTLPFSSNQGMAWFGKDLKDHMVPNPCHKQGYVPLEDVVNIKYMWYPMIVPGSIPCRPLKKEQIASSSHHSELLCVLYQQQCVYC